MRINIRIEQTPDHPLVLSLVLGSFRLEKLHALLAQRESYLDALFTKRQLGRRRQKVRNDLDVAQWLIRVGDFPFQILPFPCANIRRQ